MNKFSKIKKLKTAKSGQRRKQSVKRPKILSVPQLKPPNAFPPKTAIKTTFKRIINILLKKKN